MGIYKSTTKVTSNTRTRKKNDLLKKLSSRVTDNCMNTSSCLVRKYAGYFPADITQTFSACILIVIASLNCARKSRSSFRMQQRRQINFYNNISEKYFPSLSISNHFTFDLCLQQVWNTNLTLARLRYTSDEKKTYFRNSDFTHSKIQLTHTNKLAEFKKLGSCDNDY